MAGCLSDDSVFKRMFVLVGARAREWLTACVPGRVCVCKGTVCMCVCVFWTDQGSIFTCRVKAFVRQG